MPKLHPVVTGVLIGLIIAPTIWLWHRPMGYLLSGGAFTASFHVDPVGSWTNGIEVMLMFFGWNAMIAMPCMLGLRAISRRDRPAARVMLLLGTVVLGGVLFTPLMLSSLGIVKYIAALGLTPMRILAVGVIIGCHACLASFIWLMLRRES